MEKRTVIKSKVQIRSDEKTGERWIEGLIPYNKKSCDLGGYVEVITPTAFKKTLGDNANVYALFAHDNTKVLGATRSGTLILENTEEGLVCKCKLGTSSWANDAWDTISRGDNTQMSFGFYPFNVRSERNVDFLESVKLEEVSFCVSNPAYEDTHSKVALRSLNQIRSDFELMNEEDKETFINTILKNEEEEMKLSDEDFEKLVEAVADKLATRAEVEKVEETEAEEQEQTTEVIPDNAEETPAEEKNTDEERDAEASDDADDSDSDTVLVDDTKKVEEEEREEENKKIEQEKEDFLALIDKEVC